MDNIVILGGGFGGIRAALDLEKKLRHEKDWRIILIDKNPYHLFTPNLYEVASVYGIKKEPYQIKLRGSVSIPYDQIFRKTKVKFVQAEIQNIDISKSLITTGGGEDIDFEYLVLALGGEANTFNIPGISEYAYQMKYIDDGIAINEKLNDLLQEAKEGKRELPIQIIIGGGGFTGVETAAELACCMEVLRNKCNLTKGCIQLSLIEAGQSILPNISEGERLKIKKRLTKLGVRVIEGRPIKELKNDSVILDGERLRSDMTIWTGGIKCNPLISRLKDSILLDEKKNLVLIDAYLRAKTNSGTTPVFALGDNALVIDPKTQKPVPAMAYIAIDQAKIIAQNIVRTIKAKPLREYKPWYGAWIAPVGGKYALAHYNNLTISGLFGWVIRELVDLRYFLTILPIFKALRLFFKDIVLFSKND